MVLFLNYYILNVTSRLLVTKKIAIFINNTFNIPLSYSIIKVVKKRYNNFYGKG